MHPGLRGGDAASSQTAHCSSVRQSPSRSHAGHGFPKQSIYVLSATLRGLQGLMGCERGWGFSSCFQLCKHHTLSPSTQGLSSDLPRQQGCMVVAGAQPVQSEGPGAFHPNTKHIQSICFLSPYLISQVNMLPDG